MVAWFRFLLYVAFVVSDVCSMYAPNLGYGNLMDFYVDSYKHFSPKQNRFPSVGSYSEPPSPSPVEAPKHAQQQNVLQEFYGYTPSEKYNEQNKYQSPSSPPTSSYGQQEQYQESYEASSSTPTSGQQAQHQEFYGATSGRPTSIYGQQEQYQESYEAASSPSTSGQQAQYQESYEATSSPPTSIYGQQAQYQESYEATSSPPTSIYGQQAQYQESYEAASSPPTSSYGQQAQYQDSYEAPSNPPTSSYSQENPESTLDSDQQDHSDDIADDASHGFGGQQAGLNFRRDSQNRKAQGGEQKPRMRLKNRRRGSRPPRKLEPKQAPFYQPPRHQQPKAPPPPAPKKYIPVVIKTKKKKKSKILSRHFGFYTPGGTSVYGKFKNLKSCETACEITPTCFAGDFDPWKKKCFLHSNLTACEGQTPSKGIIHFRKVPCVAMETSRGLITLGTQLVGGVIRSGTKSLRECISECATQGGGVAAMPSTASTTPQLCFGIDFNFADHTCYFHTDIAICGGITSTLEFPITPVNLIPNPSVINILICPLDAENG